MTTTAKHHLRLVHFNDVYQLANLSRLQTFLSQLHNPLDKSADGTTKSVDAVILAGDFLSPSPLSALDGGKSMVQTLKACGITHVSLGNHEADLPSPRLYKRLHELTHKSNTATTVLNANVQGTSPENDWLHQAPFVTTDAALLTAHADPNNNHHTTTNNLQVGLIGLLSDEDRMFRDGTFRGATIHNVLDTYTRLYNDYPTVPLIPITHQSMSRDLELAQHMLTTLPTTGNGLILGGHEHVPMDETVTQEQTGQWVRILKSGCEAEAVHLIDLVLETPINENDTQQHQQRPVLTDAHVEFVEMKYFQPSIVVQRVIDSHMQLLTELENEEILNAQPFFPPGTVFSSVGTRYRQTSVGAILCMAIKEELEVDVAMINGATIKGNRDYEDGSMSYAQLKAELPFPTKMVVVKMKRWQLQDAIHYSRTNPPQKEEQSDKKFERKGYLQVDVEFDQTSFHTGGHDDDLLVALPRNLMNGFCKIEPLMALGDQLKEEGTFPNEDDFIPALDLVVRHFCKERWYELVRQKSFDEMDLDHKGFLTRSDVKRLMKSAIGREPSDFVVDDMIAAIDADDNGVIDPGELSHLLAHMEREHGNLLRFD